MRALPFIACRMFSRFLCGLGALAAPCAPANPADLDAGFNSTGSVLTTLSGRNAAARSIAVQPDGKFLVAGYVAAEGGLDAEGFLLARYRPDGTLDTDFGTGGIVITDFSASGEARCVLVQADGKIVTAGTARSAAGDADFALARYHADGSADISFNGTGQVLTSVSPHADTVNSLAIQPDGKLVVAGTRSDSSGTNDDFAVARYLPDGTLDSGFNGGGIAVTVLGPLRDAAGTVLVQRDGCIVVAGSVQSAAGNDFAVVRYTGTGLPDPAFSGDGVAVLSTGADEGATGAALQRDGRIVIAGYSFGVSDADFAAVRLLPDGTLDASFGGTGRVIVPVSTGQDIGTSVAIQNDGKLVLAGYSQMAGSNGFAFLRLLPDGTPDTTFNGTGRRLVQVSAGFNIAEEVTLQEDGRILAAGFSDSNFNSSIAVCRLLGDPASIIAVEHPAGTRLGNGDKSGIGFGSVATGSPGQVLSFRIRNLGGGVLSGLRAALDNAVEFQIENPAAEVIAPGGESSLVVRFRPAASGPREAVLSIASNDLSDDPFTVRLSGIGTSPGAAWRQQYFGSPLNEGPGADLNDADHDGSVNLLEFATGGNPLQPDRPSITVSVRDGILHVTHQQHQAAAGEVSLLPEWSNDPGTQWHPATAAPVVISEDDHFRSLQTSFPVQGLRLFVRFRATRLQIPNSHNQ